MREAILASAFDLFCRKGYNATTMSEIAKGAGMTVANVYVYFDSKLLVFYAIYTPWLLDRIEGLRESVQKFPTPRSKIKRIIVGVWGDIPAADHAFASALVEALASAPKEMRKPSDLLVKCESLLTEMILQSVPIEKASLVKDGLFSHILWMAYDGFAINSRIGDTRDLDAIASLMADMLLGHEDTENEEHKTKSRKTPRLGT
ncbi:hypothetical protein LMG23994_07060 [Cupriavidus pinatubonensis]|uniref:HTH tetR-type domain-containing protein n=2 Tax=Cupriavidus pinatubonensis TaxID=248026 RepID=A0ABM8Y496_9BURK|nr:hypothetical protein LMG23994_07060 [Cupriavidus pinatubonensis]